MDKLQKHISSFAALFLLSADFIGFILFAGLLRIAYAAGGYLYENPLEPFMLVSIFPYIVFLAFAAVQIYLHRKLADKKQSIADIAAIFILGIDFISFALFVGLSKIAEEIYENAGISFIIYIAAIIFVILQICIWKKLKDDHNASKS